MNAVTQAACLYQETRLNLDPTSPESVVDLLIPAHNASFASRQSPKRRRLDSVVQSYDEKSFSASHLAIESSIYFRQPSSHSKSQKRPHAILWRVLEERKLLEIQALDLYQNATDNHEPLLTLRLSFTNPIRPAGVLFTEEEQHGNSSPLVLFVSTIQGELYTLSLRREFFENAGIVRHLEESPHDWYKCSAPASFNYNTPYRFLSKNDREVWASLVDGSIVKLEAKDGTSWKESLLSTGGWGSSLKNMLPWKSQNTVRYAGADLMPGAAMSMAVSPTETHLWTVCLDHTLKAWSINTGKIVRTLDLSGDMGRDFQKEHESLLDPSHTHLLKVIAGKRDEEYTLVTFSPQNHDFKFWKVTHDDVDSAPSIVDAREDFSFVAPIGDLADTTIWRLEEFQVSLAPRKRNDIVIWMLVRFGTRCQAYRTNFNIDASSRTLTAAWRNNWSFVDPGCYTTETLKHDIQNPSETEIGAFQWEPAGAVEKWMDFLFYPGRFTSATLETALVIYKNGLGLESKGFNLKSARRTQTLKERVSNTVGASCRMNKTQNESIAFEKYEHDIATQWQIFYGVVRDLHKRKEEVLSLAYDSEEDISWLVMADNVSAIRSCSESEILWLNREKFAQPDKLNANSLILQSLEDIKHSQLGQLFKAISCFRNSLPKSALLSFNSAVKAELFMTYESGTELERILALYDRVNLADQVSDDDYNELVAALELLGGFAALSSDTLLAPLALLEEAQHGHSQNRQLTRYGARILICGAQGTIQSATEILMDLLLLVVFLAAEWEQSGYPRNFQVGRVFDTLIRKLRHLALLDWLASNIFVESVSHRDNRSESKDALAKERNVTLTATLLEALFIGDWSTMATPKLQSQSQVLTYWIRAWTFGAQLDSQYDNVVAFVLGTLIKKREFQLATDFVKYVPESPWTNYLKGRLNLEAGLETEAAICFQSSAPSLSSNFNLKGCDSATIIAPHEEEYFNEGLPRYYLHVASLFENKKVLSYVGDFTQLALDVLEEDDETNIRLRSDLLSRLFNSSLQTSRFVHAFESLNQYTDSALRRAALHSLLQALLSQSRVDLVLSLPFSPEFAAEVDAHISSLVPKTPGSVSISTSTDAASYHKILYALRLQRNDLRGAASCLWERLQVLKATQDQGLLDADADEEITEIYLVLLNVLSLMDPEQAWILTRPLQQTRTAANLIGSASDGGALGKLGKLGEASAQEHTAKRKVVTLDDVRRMFQDELDRIADVEAGRFPLTSVDMVDLGADGSMQVDDVDVR